MKIANETLVENCAATTGRTPAARDQIANRDAYEATTIRDSMVFGTPGQVIAKLKQYQAAGVDQFCYGASFGLPHDFALRSLELFITEVMPHFASQPAGANR